MGKREEATQRIIKENNISDRKRDDRTAATIAEERRGNLARDKRRRYIQSL
ncbi:hypothetical protein KAS08_00415 [Candidatus Pacearchaeota archaeon]|nr:hypothetical protein [Candidatus Pacearchaeota archaeon]